MRYMMAQKKWWSQEKALFPYLRTLCHSFASEYIYFFVVKLANTYESGLYKMDFLMAVIRKWQEVFSNDRFGFNAKILFKLLHHPFNDGCHVAVFSRLCSRDFNSPPWRSLLPSLMELSISTEYCCSVIHDIASGISPSEFTVMQTPCSVSHSASDDSFQMITGMPHAR